jgi:SNF2 family DNA or RNA helicase
MLKIDLFPHQKEAVDKLKELPNVAFFDDMGVGKTYQAIAIDDYRRSQAKGKTLVITLNGPMTIQWRKAFQTATNLSVVIVDPKDKEDSWQEFKDSNADVLITHWESLWKPRSSTAKFSFFKCLVEEKWLHVIADEAQKIMHRQNQVTRNLKAIKPKYRTALTGTPTSGKPDLLWSVLNWLYPKDWTSYWKFFEQYCNYETSYQGYKVVTGPKNVPELQNKIKPFTVRRLLRDVRKNMPERMPPLDFEVQLEPSQRKAYEEMKADMVAWVRSQNTSGEMEPIIAQAAISKLVRLLQFASAYATVDAEGKVLLSEPSPKLDFCMQLIETALEEDVKLVVFSNFRQLIELLNARLTKAKVPYVTVHGEVSTEDRIKGVQQFQEGDAKVFTGTIKAGGTGIDLFAAHRIVFLERDWSPSANEQAIGRVDRIGQTQAVQVIDIIAADTVESQKNATIEMKWSWIKELLDFPKENTND